MIFSAFPTLLFWTYALTIALAPLPFGGVHALSQAFFAVIIFALVLLWSLTRAVAGRGFEVSLGRIAPETVCLGLVLAWIGVQMLPCFSGLACHPLWQEAQTALGEASTSAFTPARGAALESLLRLATYAAAFWLALQFGRERRRARQLFVIVALSGTIYAVYGLVIHFGGLERVLWVERAGLNARLSATMIYPNSYATLAGFGLLCAAGLYQSTLRQAFETGRYGRDKIAYFLQQALKQGAPQLAGILILLTALFLTGSRAGVTCGLVGVFCLLYFLALTHRQKSPLVRIFAFCLPLGLLAVYLLSGDGWEHRLLGTDLGREDRLIAYRQVWETVQAAPWAGYGAGSFAQVFPMFADELHSHWDKVHNDWLETVFDLGWPAAILWFAALGGLGLRCLAGVFRRRRDRIYPGVGCSACILVGLHALTDFSLQIPAVAMTFAVLLGVGVGQSWPTRFKTSSWSRA